MTLHWGNWVAAGLAAVAVAVIAVVIFAGSNSKDRDKWGVPDGQWSPDGRSLVFTSDHSGNLEIYVRKDGKIQRLTKNNDVDTQASWSPDGRRIAFQRGHDDGDDLYVMDADGDNATRLTTDDDSHINGRATWSPEGKELLFTTESCLDLGLPLGGSPPCSVSIQRVAANGGPVGDFGRDGDSQPDWSRTGLVVVESLKGFAVSRRDGTRRRLLAASGTDPAWSPDGSRIVYACDAGLCVVRARGGRARVIASTRALPGLIGDEIDRTLDWSADGRKILFAHGPYYYSGGPTHLYVVGVNGHGLHRVVFDWG